nr:retrovirus-related Pol polyprotein from transposon TNT 1-94 [Tanacetum cinerariifolium]
RIANQSGTGNVVAARAENDNHVTYVALSMVQSGGTVETSYAPNEEIRAHQETVYRNLVDQVAQEKYDKLEKCYQKSVYQEQCLTRKINALHLSSAKQIRTLNDEIFNLNKQLSKEKSSISSIMDEKKRLKHDFKIREDKFLDKEVDQEAKIKDLENILLKRDQTVQTIHMLNPKPDLFYHPNQKMALGYPNPSYLKKAQLKQKSLYNGNLLLKEHDPPGVYDSEETLELAQENRVFVPQTTKSKEELFLSNVSNTVTIPKTISIPIEDLLNDITLCVARKFLNEVKSSLVTLQRVVKQKMTLEIYIWSSSAHKEVHRIISYEIAPIIHQVDARVQNFEIQFLQEAAKFVRDFKSLAKEADESLDKQNHLKTTYKNLFESMKSNWTHAKLHELIFENAKLSAWLFKNTSESMKNTSGTSVTPHVDKPKLSAVTPLSKKLHASMPSHSVPQPREFNENMSYNMATASSTRLVHTARTRRPQPKGNTRNVKVPSASKSSEVKKIVVQICMWCVDSGYSKDMTGNIKLLINFVWNFLGTVRFGNDHIAAILGYGDLKWGNITITRVYFVEGLGHNLFSVGQFCDADLEVAFRRNTCFIRDLDGINLLKGNHSTNLYTINLYEMASASPICLMARATPIKSWLWHQRLSHLNFDTINDLAKNDLVFGLPKFKYAKEHLCTSCEQGKSKRASHPPKLVLNSKQWLHLLHMDLCGPMRVASINGKRAGITHETSAAKTPQQNGVIERRNHTLVKAAKTMLIFSYALLFLWAEAIATAKPDISYLHVFRALCYPKNDREDIGKLGAKGDIGFFIGYSANFVSYIVYNRRTRKIMKTMNVTFDELSANKTVQDPDFKV